MSTIELGRGASAWGLLARNERAVLWLYAVTICLSALLLFSVQPMFARMVLPKLGGAPSVWAVSMCFFQATLLAGYCYAHLLNRYVGPGRAVAVHLALLALATIALPIGLPAGATEPPSGDAYLWLVGILALGVGLPFLAISANAPLLQSWYGRTGHAHAADPYFLYGASNAGSLAALLLYPIVLEPTLGLNAQSTAWTIGFLALAVAIALCGIAMQANAPTFVRVGAEEAARPASPAPTWADRGLWIGLAFVPSGLLVAFTTYVTTDIASAPFLWVLPLAVFLATFILVFRDPPLIPHGALVERLPLVVALMLFFSVAGGMVGSWVSGLASSAAFVVASLVCHRELYERRPSGERLTEFYLWMSLGGVLGGVFAALVAPHLFTSIFEFPLLAVAALYCRPQILSGLRDREGWREFVRLAAMGIGALLVVDGMVRLGLFSASPLLSALIMLVLICGAYLARRQPKLELALLTVLLVATVVPADSRGVKEAVRSFFGVHRVLETPNGDFRVLIHGTTVHGAQRLKDEAGKPLVRPVPASYYHAQGPMARALALAEPAQPGATGRRVGIIGLGAGSMACHARSGDTWRLFEIDPVVVDIARDTRHFGFLGTCLPTAVSIVGDARLTVLREPDRSFDYLLIDAFSSDSIPVHLLTVEALRQLDAKLAPGAVMALHISNRHLDLAPVVAANVAQIPGLEGVLVVNKQPTTTLDASSSVVVLLTRSPEQLARIKAWPDALPLEAKGVRAWTDDYADILSAIVRGYTR